MTTEAIADATPARLAARVHYEPLAALLARFESPRLPPAEALNDLLRERGEPVLTDGGAPVRFAPPPDDGLAYEQRVRDTGVVATRPDDWHDFFNALVWAVFPRSKAALNARHCAESALAAAQPPGRRSPARDAVTQFDESGLVVASADPALPRLLAERRWRELFWERRADVVASMRFLVFGHGLYDSLRAPFLGLCGKVVVVDVEPALLVQPAAARLEAIDALVAARVRDPAGFRSPRELLPLPVLGIPGATPANECAAYYEDERQFRPVRRG